MALRLDTIRMLIADPLPPPQIALRFERHRALDEK
jgi:hypothetical protein